MFQLFQRLFLWPLFSLFLLTSLLWPSSIIIKGQLLTKFLDNLACRRSIQNGHYGECMPRRCCRSEYAVRNLCLTSTDSVCCYGEDYCRLEDDRRRFPGNGGGGGIIDNSVNRPIESYPNRGIVSDYCERYLVRRMDWQAQPSTKRPYRMPVRVDHVIVHHTGDDEDQCYSLEQCRYRLRQMQSYYQREKQFPDIPWNFLISNNGDIFEGVGWDSQGYHTENWNDRSIGIAFIGDYDREAPTNRAMQALQHLLDCGVEQRVLDRFYRLQGHRDMRPTGCPGDYLYAALRQLKGTNRITNSADLVGNDATSGDSSSDLFIDDEDLIDDDEVLTRTDLNATTSIGQSDANKYSHIEKNRQKL